MRLCNIKISIYFERDLIPKKKSNEKNIFHMNSWTITIYLHSPNHANVTGIREKDEIRRVIYQLEEKFAVKSTHHCIDSAMVSHKDNKRLKIDKIRKALQPFSALYHMDYEPEIFSGIFLKPTHRQSPTINLFFTGSYQLLGGKTFDLIEKSIQIVQTVIKNSLIDTA